MDLPSVKIQEKQRTLTDQDAKDVAQYTRETFNLEREISHYGRAVAFLDLKNIVCISHDIDDRNGKSMRTPHDLISKHLPVPHYFESLNYNEYTPHQILKQLSNCTEVISSCCFHRVLQSLYFSCCMKVSRCFV